MKTRNLLLLLVLLVCVTAAQAVPPPTVSPFDKTTTGTIPDLNQKRDYEAPFGGAAVLKWCAPTAAADCVWYYGAGSYPNLIPLGANDNVKADNLIIALGTMMGTSDAGGGTATKGPPPPNAVDGLQQYYDTFYPGQFNVDYFTAWTFPDNQGNPSAQNLWNFMTNALEDCNDVLPIISYGGIPASETAIPDVLDSVNAHLVMMTGYSYNASPDSITFYDPDDAAALATHAFPLSATLPSPVTRNLALLPGAGGTTAIDLVGVTGIIVGAIISGPNGSLAQTDDLDWGDAPEPAGGGGYPTTSGNSGANHIIGGPYLDDGTGTDGPDAEPDGQPNGNATGDDSDANGDDEDGVLITPSPLVPGGFATLSFTVAGAPGCVDAWIDWNQDQIWDDSAGSNEKVPGACFAVGPGLLNILVPANALPGQTFARIRISTNGGLPPTGGAPDGEVEDHEVFVKDIPDPALKFQQLPLDGPDYFGHDEISTAYTHWDFSDPEIPMDMGYEGCYMADDFADLERSPVIKVKWWGSYPENNDTDRVLRFLIAFERDVPADIAQQIPSHPGEVLYSEIVNLALALPLNPGEFSETVVAGSGGPPCNEALWEYEALLLNPFPQDPNTVYWLKIVALYDIDSTVMENLLSSLAGTGFDLCDFMNMPSWEQDQYYDDVDLPRWGWHNRDYTKRDPYASTPPAVVPGEHLAGTIYDPISGADLEVWHFQDDAVSGDVQDPTTWQEEHYAYTWPWCGTSPPYVDGPGPSAEHPEGIAEFSKDLAFELWTTDECVKPTAPFYNEWLGSDYAGTPLLKWASPDCWCYIWQCRGDTDGITGLYKVDTIDLATFVSAFSKGDMKLDQTKICADLDHMKGLYRVDTTDLGIFVANFSKGAAKVKDCALDWEDIDGPGPGVGDGDNDYNFWCTPGNCP